jgi:hypothetical protein
MRNNTPQVETREISDSDLDNISGGVGIGIGLDGLPLVSQLTSALPLGQVTGLVSGLTGTLTGATGLSGITSIVGL